MIKAKPKKKREIKINEVKEINIIKKPSDIKLESNTVYNNNSKHFKSM